MPIAIIIKKNVEEEMKKKKLNPFKLKRMSLIKLFFCCCQININTDRLMYRVTGTPLLF
jgi:hypothetical protein